MNGIYFWDMLGTIMGENPFLARLFFASIEVTVLALVVTVLIRLCRIRSPRLVALLWLVVLVKPIASLALGSFLPVACFGPSTGVAENIAMTETTRSMSNSSPGRDLSHWESPSADLAFDAATRPLHPAAGNGSSEIAADCLPPESGIGSWLPDVLLAMWFATMVFSLGRYVRSFVQLRRVVAAGSVPNELVGQVYRSMAQRLGIRRLPRLVLTEAMDSPAMAGLFRPVILMPTWLADRGAHREYVWSLRHELMHWRWLDPLSIAIRDLAAILFAFHPVIWWAARRQTEAIELACDQAVLQCHDDATDYAEQLCRIVEQIHRRRVAVAGGLFATRTQIGRRIAALLDNSHAKAKRLTVFSVAGVLLLAASALAVGATVRGGNDQGSEREPGQPLEQQADTSKDHGAREAASETRLLRFPKTHRIAVVFSRPPRDDMGMPGGWELVGPAQGRVTVPADRDIQLRCTEQGVAFPDKSPGDVQHFWFWCTPSDSAMKYMAGCGKLKWLTFDAGLPNPASWKYFSKMRSLESLHVLPTDLRSSMGSQRYRDLIGYLEGLPSFRCLEVFGAQVTDDDLAELRRLPRLEQYGFLSNRIHGRGLVHLAALPRLRQLMIRSESITDGGLDALGGCKSLRNLTLYCPKLTAAGYAPLAKLNSLEELELSDLPLSDDVLAHLAGLRSLKKLNLARVQGLTDAGLSHLGGLTSLEDLCLVWNRNITDAGLGHLRRLTKMKRLAVNTVRCTGVGFQSLEGMKQIESLLLPSHCTDKDMAVFGKLTSLKDLTCSGRDLTNAGLAQLKNLKSLECLSVSAGKATGSGFLALSGLPLKSLYWRLRLDEKRLTPLTGFPQLEILEISPPANRRGEHRSCLWGEDLAPLAKLTRLKVLTISCSDIRGFDAALLARMPLLEDLSIANFETTDQDLKGLAKIKNLKRLQIRGDFSEEGLLGLRGLKRLSELYVTMDKPLSREARKRFRVAIPSLANLYVRKNTVKAAQRPRVGGKSPSFSYVSLDDKRGQLKDYRGKVVLLHFWSTSCAPCVASLPGVKRSYDSIRREHDDFVMLSLCISNNKEAVRSLAEKHQMTWPQVCLSLESEVAADYGVAKFPSYFVVGRDGKIVFDNTNGKKLKDVLAKALER